MHSLVSIREHSRIIEGVATWVKSESLRPGPELSGPRRLIGRQNVGWSMPSLHSLPPPSKKRKINKVDNAQSIKQLEDKITDAVANNTSLNPLVDLLTLTQNIENPQDTSKAIYALYRVFVVIIANGKLEPGGDEPAKVVKAWIWERLQTYVDYLGGLLQDDEKFLRVRQIFLFK